MQKENTSFIDLFAGSVFYLHSSNDKKFDYKNKIPPVNISGAFNSKDGGGRCNVVFVPNGNLGTKFPVGADFNSRSRIKDVDDHATAIVFSADLGKATTEIQNKHNEITELGQRNGAYCLFLEDLLKEIGLATPSCIVTKGTCKLDLYYIFDKTATNLKVFKNLKKKFYQCYSFAGFYESFVSDTSSYIVPGTNVWTNGVENPYESKLVFSSGTGKLIPTDYNFITSKVDDSLFTFHDSNKIISSLSYLDDGWKGSDKFDATLADVKNYDPGKLKSIRDKGADLLGTLGYNVQGHHIHKGSDRVKHLYWNDGIQKVISTDLRQTTGGGPLQFLWNHLKNDYKKLNKHLNEHYDLLISKSELPTELKGDRYEFDGMSVVFTGERCVFIEGEDVADVFIKTKGGIKFKGIAYTNKVEGMGSKLAEPSLKFIFEVDGKKIEMDTVSSTRKFNEKYNKKNIYLGKISDYVLQMFFYTLQNSMATPQIPVIKESGHYDGYTVIGKDVIGELKEDVIIESDSRLIGETELKQTTVKEFAKYMDAIVDKKMRLPLLLQGIALYGMNKTEKREFRPAMFIYGMTGVGKSFLQKVVRCMLNMTGEDAVIPMNATTAQPLKDHLSKNCPLYIEERTQMLGSQKNIENLFRVCITKEGSRTSRGRANSNVYWDLKAKVFIVGESVPHSDSVCNRMVFLTYNKEQHYKKNENYDSIIEQLLSRTCVDEIVSYYQGVSEQEMFDQLTEAKNILVKKIEELTGHKKQQRFATIRAFTYVINKHFQLCTEEEYFEMIKYRTTFAHLEKSQTPKNQIAKLLRLISVGIPKYGIIPAMKGGDESGGFGLLKFYRQDEFFDKNNVKSILSNLANSEYSENFLVTEESFSIWFKRNDINHPCTVFKQVFPLCGKLIPNATSEAIDLLVKEFANAGKIPSSGYMKSLNGTASTKSIDGPM